MACVSEHSLRPSQMMVVPTNLLFRDFGEIGLVQDQNARLGGEDVKLMVPAAEWDLSRVREVGAGQATAPVRRGPPAHSRSSSDSPGSPSDLKDMRRELTPCMCRPLAMCPGYQCVRDLAAKSKAARIMLLLKTDC